MTTTARHRQPTNNNRCRRIIITTASAFLTFCLVITIGLLAFALQAGIIQGIVTPAYGAPAPAQPCSFWDDCSAPLDYSRFELRP